LLSFAEFEKKDKEVWQHFKTV